MRDIRTGILPADGLCRLQGRSRGSPVDDSRFQRLRLQERCQIVFIGQRLATGPGRSLAQRLQGGLGAMLGFADDAGKAAVAHDSDEAGNGARAILLQSAQLRTCVGRPEHAAVQHVRQRLIVDEARPGEHLVRNVDPRNRTSRQRAARGDLGCCARCGVAIERDFAGQLPITCRDIARPRNGAVLDFKHIDLHAQPFRGQFKKDLANLGTGMSQRTAGLLDRETAGSDALVRT